MNPTFSLRHRLPGSANGDGSGDGLNQEQRRAVEAGDGPLLVLSGAGTGKTRVLTMRVAHLLATGRARPSELLVVTFTNKAAREMRSRVEALTGRAVSGWWLGTFHALGARILRRHAQLVELDSDYAILDTDDQKRVIKQVLSANNIDPKRWPPEKLLYSIDRWKNLGLTPDRADHEGKAFAGGRGLELYAAYQRRLQQLNATDFGDLLLHNLTLFRDTQILEEWQARVRHILVDEYQDTNTAQHLWIRQLAGARGNVCAVGDEDQSIYGWRGAQVGNILSFREDFPAAQVVRLEQNYRSTGHILGAASALIGCNQMRLGKTLWTQGSAGEPVRVRQVQDSEDEARLISDEIELLRREGTPLDRIAVLLRTTALILGFEERFLKIGLPYQVVGGLRFFERQEVRDAVAYLRLVQHEHDDLALERIIGRPRRGIGTTTFRKLAGEARLRNTSVESAGRALLAAGQVRGTARGGLRELFRALDHWRELAPDQKPHELAETVLEQSGYLDMLRRDSHADAAGRYENLQELLNALRDFEHLRGFLEHVALVHDRDGPATEPRVSLMTLHAAKGLEFDVVFLPAWEDGLFPHDLAVLEGGDEGLEEERRLAYVGPTRAPRGARGSWGSRRRAFRDWGEGVPSR
ncbi:MAG: UvrD-helicase domain-containing protein, partial [Rhodospirillales bacterium]|nr:UvrD-helicase domain-containing protein [Rhodospirillales bacterium]